MFSGAQPTGVLHVGNLFGALANWVNLARDHDGIFCIVDQHALTVEHDANGLRERIRDVAIGYIAAGIDPSRSIVFVQSDVPEHTELAWYLGAAAQYGELTRMTQFKEKSEQAQGSASAALFSYPVLMAADILLYKATMVPVGDDQTQHLELTRNVAHRFNTRFGETFPLPRPHYSAAPRIMGTDGLRKMSKSLGNYIGMLEDDATIWTKLQPAFTDPQRQRRADPGRPEVCNVFRLHGVVTPSDQVASVEQQCRTAAIGCRDCKQILAKHLGTCLDPIRERARALSEKPEAIEEILRDGAQRARAIARETIGEVRERLGIRRIARGV